MSLLHREIRHHASGKAGACRIPAAEKLSSSSRNNNNHADHKKEDSENDSTNQRSWRQRCFADFLP